MSFRSTTDIEASFRIIERRLDAMLGESRVHLERERIALRDDSNRSGFSKDGFPYFMWGYHFERREAFGSEIKAAAVNLRYVEPIEVAADIDPHRVLGIGANEEDQRPGVVDPPWD